MDFGRVTSKEINTVDFTLDKDSDFTTKILASSRKLKKPLIYIGCAKWGRKEWVGQIYPKGTKEINFLDHYVNHFNSIELNATHYKIYGPESIEKWSLKAGKSDFLFCPKWPQSISHYSNLVSPQAASQTDAFFKGILAFGKHLGPLFLQLSDKFSPAKKENLFSYLQSLPKDLNIFLELRHPDWFKPEFRQEWLELLKKLKMGAVITDTSGRRDCAHMELTQPKTFIRFVGNNLHPSDYTRIDKWVIRIKHWLDQGLRELYFFMHQHDEKDSPALCQYLIEQMNAVCGTELKLVKFVSDKDNTLF